jgi:hypothetical protein
MAMVICLLMVSFSKAPAQTPSISIKASARVVDVAEIEMITISDLQIDLNMAVNGIINISPLTDPEAGVMMAKGRAGAYARISFLHETKLQNKFGKGEMIFTYEVNGFLMDNQNASEPLDAVERMIQLNQDGHYYLWIGGRIDVSNARPGSYAGEFTLEIEYI